jgi:hypothetical protein
MLFDKKKAAGIILGKMHKDGTSEHEEKPHFAEGGAVENVDHDFEGLHAAAQELTDAVHSKSAMDVHKALSSYLELHKQLQPGDPADGGPPDAEPQAYESAQMKYNK